MKNIQSLTVEKVDDSLEVINDVTNQLASALKREGERKDVRTFQFPILLAYYGSY